MGVTLRACFEIQIASSYNPNTAPVVAVDTTDLISQASDPGQSVHLCTVFPKTVHKCPERQSRNQRRDRDTKGRTAVPATVAAARPLDRTVCSSRPDPAEPRYDWSDAPRCRPALATGQRRAHRCIARCRCG